MSGVTYTAQVLGQFSTLDFQGLLNLLLCVVAAALLATPLQAILEGLISSALPSYLLFVKPFLPSAISSLMGGIAVHLGVSPQDALVGASALASFTHWVNEQSWAVDLEKKYPEIGKIAQDLDTTGNKSATIGKIPAVLLAIGLSMALAGTAKAGTLNLTQDFGAGLDRYNVAQGGVVLPTGVTAISYGLNLDYTINMVPLSSTAAVPDRILVLTSGPAWSPLVQGPGGLVGWHIEIGSQIPSTPVNLVVGTIADFGTGQKNPWGITGAINFQFGGTLKSWVVNL
jgi:hypothetical protein